MNRDTPGKFWYRACMRRHGLIGLLCVAALFGGWWLLSPLVLNTTVNEPDPLLDMSDAERDLLEQMETITPEQLQRMPQKQREELISTFNALQEKMPSVDMRDIAPKHTSVLASGTLEDGDALHHGKGTAQILRLDDGALVLRLSDLEVTNGPALHVYLTVDEDGGTERGFADLGPLKGNRGNQNYDIPPEVEISQYRGVSIWCVPFGVLFASARL